MENKFSKERKRSNVLQGYLLRSTVKQELEGRCMEVSQMKAVKMHIQGEEAIWKDNHLTAADPSQRKGFLTLTEIHMQTSKRKR